MSQGTVMPCPKFTGFDDSGNIVPAGLLYTYAAGTTTPQNTYNAVDLDPANLNANPVVLDAAGRATVFLLAASYKFVLKTSAGTTIWTQDNISQVPLSSGNLDILGTAGEALTAGNVVYMSDGSGGLTTGRWYKADADFTYASLTPIIGMVPSDIALGASGAIRIAGRMTGLSGLSAGVTYYVSGTAGALTATAPANARIVGQADTTTSIVIVANPAVAQAAVAGNLDIDGVAGEALSAGNFAYLSDGSGALTAGRWYKADADLLYGSLTAVIGFVPSAINSAATGKIRLGGTATGLTLVAGSTYFVSATAGAITATAPTNARTVGVALSTTVLALDAHLSAAFLQQVLRINAGTPYTLTLPAANATGSLTNNGSGVLSWVPTKVVQIVTATYATQVDSSSNTFADTGLTASITPTSATNKVLVLAQIAGIAKVNDTYVQLKALRDSTSLGSWELGGGYTGTATANRVGGSGFNYLDSPASTSALVYKVQMASGSNIATATVQQNNCVSSIVLMEVTP